MHFLNAITLTVFILSVSCLTPPARIEAQEIKRTDHGYIEGCDWYCGAPEPKVTATSTLLNQQVEFSASNLHDDNKSTAWVGGAAGNGIGERISFHFDVTSYPYLQGNDLGIDTVSIINGYAKSPQLWNAYNRVKKLNIIFNGKLLGAIFLRDTITPQEIKLPRMPFRKGRINTVTFEILEIYPGKINHHTALADFHFSGFGVH